MSIPVFIATEQLRRYLPGAPRWTVLENTRLQTQIDTIQLRRYLPGSPRWTVLEDTQLRSDIFAEPLRRYVPGAPRWTELAPSIPTPELAAEPGPTQPYIDSLAPVTVGSAWRNATLEASKIKTTATLPVLYPQPGATIPGGDSLFIPCGDRIQEFGDVLVEDNYSLPSGPGLLNNKTIIMLDTTLVYMNGTQQSGWTVVSAANLINGFNYTLSPPSPIATGTHTLSVYLEGVDGFLAEIEFDTELPDLDKPYLINLNPASGETWVAVDSTIEGSVVDDFTGVDVDTVVITVDGVIAWQSDTQQNGFIVVKSAASPSGFGYAITTPADFSYGDTIPVRFEADDLSIPPNSLDTTYYFYTQDEPISVVSAQALDSNTVRVTFNVDIKSSNPSDLNDALRPYNYTFLGGFRTLRVTSVSKISSTVFDLSVIEMQDGALYTVIVSGSVANASETLTIAYSGNDSATFTGIGIAPRLLSAENTSFERLTLTFDSLMLVDKSFGFVTSYSITPEDGGTLVTVTRVQAIPPSAETVVLEYTGGGSTYKVVVAGVMDEAGNYIDPEHNFAYFDINTTQNSTTYLMDTDLGAMSVEVSYLQKRNIHDLLDRRISEIGYKSQIERIADSLTSAGVQNSKKKLKLFKG